MKKLLAPFLVLPLSGCFFFYIPGPLIDKIAGRPTYCVSNFVKVGDKINISGQMYEVTSLAGPSPHYCADQPESRRMGAEAKPLP